MTCQECEALGLGREQTCCQLAVADTNLAVVGNRTGDTEALQTLTNIVGSLNSVLCLFLQSDSGTYYISPLCVLKANHLCFLTSLVRIDAGCITNLISLFDGGDTVAVQTSKDLLDTTVL